MQVQENGGLFMNKERIKGIIIGFILCAIFSTSVMVVASSQTVTREITYGINVMLNGEIVQFDYDSRPFTMGGRTFLPLRTLAELLGMPVDFDPATNTAIVGDRFAGQRRPLTQAAPHYDTGGDNGRNNMGSSSVSILNSVTMSGMTYQNALGFRSTVGRSISSGDLSHSRFTLHNLNGQYRLLTGYVGRVDGTHMVSAIINFIGDGQLLQSYELRANDMPTPISVFVEDVIQLRIQVVFASSIGMQSNIHYALVAYLE